MAGEKTRRPARWLALTLGGLLATLCTSCFQFRAVLRLSADGSGSQSVRMSFGRQIEREIQKAAVATSAGLREVFDPLVAFDEVAVREDLTERGLQLLSHETDRGFDRRSVAISAGFPDLGALRRSPLMGEDCEWFLLPGRTEGGLRMVVYPRGHRAWIAGREKARQLETEPEDFRRQFFEHRRPQLAGLDLEIRLELPGAVRYTSRNLQRTDDPAAVELRIDERSIHSAGALLRALAPRLEIEFDGSGCSLPLDERDPGLEPKDSGDDGGN